MKIFKKLNIDDNRHQVLTIAQMVLWSRWAKKDRQTYLSTSESWMRKSNLILCTSMRYQSYHRARQVRISEGCNPVHNSLHLSVDWSHLFLNNTWPGIQPCTSSLQGTFLLPKIIIEDSHDDHAFRQRQPQVRFLIWYL